MSEKNAQNTVPAAASSSAAAAPDGSNPSGDSLTLNDVLAGGGADAVDPCNVTSNLRFRFDAATGNTLVDVLSPEGRGNVTQQLVLRGVDLTSRGSLTDSQVMKLLFANG
jgi:hypothetical protein